MIKANFSGDEIPKESIHYTCIAWITIDSVMRIEKKELSLVYLEECKYKIKKTKMTKFMNTQSVSDLDSESELESDTEL